MRKFGLIVHGGKVITPSGILRADIGVSEGKIRKLGTLGRNADRVLDAAGKVVMPGVIDAHVHFYWGMENWWSGSCAAAGGGVTTIVEHPFSNPITCTGDDLRTKIVRAEKSSVVDFSFHGAGFARNVPNFRQLLSKGVCSLKVWMAESHPWYPSPKRDELPRIFEAVASCGGLASIHAESGEVIEHLQMEFKKARKRTPEYHQKSRPLEAELKAISAALAASERAGCAVYFLHVSSGMGAGLIRNAKRSRSQVYAETCPQYLLFTEKDYRKHGPMLKYIPPARTSSERAALWEHVRNGTIDTIATDHAPSAVWEKTEGWQNIWVVGNGIPGLETMLPLMWTKMNEGRLSLHRLVRLLTEGPARVLGLYPRKGVIAKGSDADLVIVDPKGEAKITVDKLHSKCDYSPFEGWTVKGIPVTTISGGEVVMEGGYPGKIVASRGRGTFVPSRPGIGRFSPKNA